MKQGRGHVDGREDVVACRWKFSVMKHVTGKGGNKDG